MIQKSIQVSYAGISFTVIAEQNILDVMTSSGFKFGPEHVTADQYLETYTREHLEVVFNAARLSHPMTGWKHRDLNEFLESIDSEPIKNPQYSYNLFNKIMDENDKEIKKRGSEESRLDQLEKRLEVIEEKYDYIQKVKSEPATDYKTVTHTPEWEILSFKIKDSNSDQISYKNTQGQFCFYHTAYCSQENMIEAGHHIHSVRRASDNTIWTVGDGVDRGKGSVISAFDVLFSNSKYLRVSVKYTSGSVEFVNINQLKKPERKPLFTTADGKGIFEGERYYFVTPEFEICRPEAAKRIHQDWRKPDRSFSTKELAEEYVWKNKPVFSYKDIYQGALNMDGRDWYEKQAKLRALNQK